MLTNTVRRQVNRSRQAQRIGKVMMSSEYSPAILRSLLDGTRFKLPLTHSNALEIVAALNHARSWNEISAKRADVDALKVQAKALRQFFLEHVVTLPLRVEIAGDVLTYIKIKPRSAAEARGVKFHPPETFEYVGVQALLPMLVAKAKHDERFYRGFLQEFPPGRVIAAADKEAYTELAIAQGKVLAVMQSISAAYDSYGGPFTFVLGDDKQLGPVVYCRPADGKWRKVAFLRGTSEDDENPDAWLWYQSYSPKEVKLPRKGIPLGESDSFCRVTELIRAATGMEVEGFPFAGIYHDATSLDGPLNEVRRTIQ